MSETTTTGPDSRGTIHDLGYERYRGTRLAQHNRFLVISRHVFAMAWRSKWGVRLPLILAGFVTIGAAAIMFMMGHQLAKMARSQGAPIPTADAVVVLSTTVFAVFGFVLATIVGCAAIADDLKTGAFQFYFSRPLRPRDYAVGKLVGVALVIGLPMFVGPVLLSFLRLFFAESFREAIAVSGVVPKAVALGLLGTAAYTLPAVAAGALLKNRRAGQAAYAIYALVVPNMAEQIAHATGVPQFFLFSMSENLKLIGLRFFRLDPPGFAPPAWQAALATFLLCAGFVWLILWRVRKSEVASLGEGS